MLAISKVLTNGLITIGVCAAMSATALAGGNGGSPNGKPFVVINDQIIEVTGAISSLQDQLELLVGRVDTTEQRILASETAVYDLQTNNAAMQALIDANTLSIDGINLVIADLQAHIADLQADVAANIGDISDLQTQILADEALIASLQIALNLVTDGLVDLGISLQGQIDNNSTLIGMLDDEIVALQEGLELKQTILSGQCPGSQFLIGVQLDGSVECEAAAGGSSTATFATRNIWKAVQLDPGQVAWNFTANCTGDWKVISGGFLMNTFNGYVRDNGHTSGEGWRVTFRNLGTFPPWFFVVAKCARVTN